MRVISNFIDDRIKHNRRRCTLFLFVPPISSNFSKYWPTCRDVPLRIIRNFETNGFSVAYNVAHERPRARAYCHKITLVITFQNFSLIEALPWRKNRILPRFARPPLSCVRLPWGLLLFEAFRGRYARTSLTSIRFLLAKLIFLLEFFCKNFITFHARKVQSVHLSSKFPNKECAPIGTMIFISVPTYSINLTESLTESIET